MIQEINKAYKPLFTEKPRYFFLMGGRGAGRSTAASQFAVAKLFSTEYFRCAIMRYILGDIRNSIYQEITDRLDEQGIFNSVDIDTSKMSIRYGSNMINAVGFRKSSGDQKSKLKSLASYNCVIIEEADEVKEEDFMQLDDSLRTVKGVITVIFLLNAPSKDHWIIKRFFNLGISEVKDFYIPSLKPEIKNAIYLRTDFRDNIKNISPETAISYENYRSIKPDYYFNMIRGLVPEVVRGKIYSGWQEIDRVPHEAKLVRRGLDFGYSNDPTALVDIYAYNGGYIFDEQLYRKGMLNNTIADFINALPDGNTLVIGDSAEPKSIDELKLYGINILPTTKGKDSVTNGIAYVQAQKIWYTKRSVNLKREYDNYAWFEDKDGKRLNEPKPGEDHCFVGDTKIVTVQGEKYIKDIIENDLVLTERGFNKVLKKHNNGIRPVKKYRLQLDTVNDIILKCTPDHKIKTNQGWIEISKLKSEMMVYLTNFSMAKSINYMPEKDIFLKVDTKCMLLCGGNIMEKYLRDFKYTIKTIIHGTTGLRIWKWLRLINIYHFISRKDLKKILNGLKNFKKKVLKKQLSGIKVELAENGINNRVKKHGLEDNTENSHVQFVENSIVHDMVEYQNIATRTVKLKHCVEEESWNEEVFDLTVENEHSYFANGVLVHNCMDALRYGLTSLLDPTKISNSVKVRYFY